MNWGAILKGYAVSLAGTIVLGGVLFHLERNIWLVAVVGTLSLFGGGFVAARRARTAAILNGAFVGVIYFATFVAIIFVGAISDWLPEPLPGLPRGDSTFFMAWPLVQLLSAIIGGLVGGRRTRCGDE